MTLGVLAAGSPVGYPFLVTPVDPCDGVWIKSTALADRNIDVHNIVCDSPNDTSLETSLPASESARRQRRASAHALRYGTLTFAE